MPVIVILFMLVVLTGGAGFFVISRVPSDLEAEPVVEEVVVENSVALPIEGYAERRTFNAFGEYSQGSLQGYHVGDDIEYTDTIGDSIPVFSIAEGVVARLGNVSGYGGVIMVTHRIDGKELNAIYGHIDASSTGLEVGERVEKGQFLAGLGAHESEQTDGERKHLHFALYDPMRFSNTPINGYELQEERISLWINPQTFFVQHGYDVTSPKRTYSSTELGGEVFPLEFGMLPNWEVEYVESIESLNIYSLIGEGTAIDRSQILIRYFDADEFLTLSIVTKHSIEDVVVGKGDYVAKEYDIEKKSDTPDFKDQPAWRNERHIAVDFRGEEGETRYFSIGFNPQLDKGIYMAFLRSLRIVQ